MSRIDYTWNSANPSKPDVYNTRRNESKYHTLRYWDGYRWFSIDWSPRRGGVPFKWPKPSLTKRPRWAVEHEKLLYLKNIKIGQDCIQWGEPFKVFDDSEVIAYLVSTGILPSDWRVAYQADMRLSKATLTKTG